MGVPGLTAQTLAGFGHPVGAQRCEIIARMMGRPRERHGQFREALFAPSGLHVTGELLGLSRVT